MIELHVDIFQASGQTLWSIIDYHNYGRMWMHPYGYTVDHLGDECVRAADHDDMVGSTELTPI